MAMLERCTVGSCSLAFVEMEEREGLEIVCDENDAIAEVGIRWISPPRLSPACLYMPDDAVSLQELHLRILFGAGYLRH